MRTCKLFSKKEKWVAIELWKAKVPQATAVHVRVEFEEEIQRLRILRMEDPEAGRPPVPAGPGGVYAEEAPGDGPLLTGNYAFKK